MENYTFRLTPGQDLMDAIESFVLQNQIEAGCVLSAVGSLTQAVLRLANHDEYNRYEGFFEIVSVTGTVSTHGSHLHIAISDDEGTTIGGHLVSGCKIYTTAEIVIIAFSDLIFQRTIAEDSGYAELAVYKK